MNGTIPGIPGTTRIQNLLRPTSHAHVFGPHFGTTHPHSNFSALYNLPQSDEQSRKPRSPSTIHGRIYRPARRRLLNIAPRFLCVPRMVLCRILREGAAYIQGRFSGPCEYGLKQCFSAETTFFLRLKLNLGYGCIPVDFPGRAANLIAKQENPPPLLSCR